MEASAGALREVTLGLVQMKMCEDRRSNLKRALQSVDKAAAFGANIVCLPELFETFYFPQRPGDATFSPEPIPNETTKRLSEAARRYSIVLVGGSLYEGENGKSFNTSVVFGDDGLLLGKYRKVHIPQDPGFYEQEYFAPGNQYRVFDTKYGRIGVLICFDQWYSEPARINKLMGADILFYPTAIGTVKGIDQTEGNWRAAWEAVQRGHSVSNSMVVASVNRVGREGDTLFWGSSFVYDQFGTLLARGSEADEEVVKVRVNLDLGRDIEAGWGFMRNRRPETYGEITRHSR